MKPLLLFFLIRPSPPAARPFRLLSVRPLAERPLTFADAARAAGILLATAAALWTVFIFIPCLISFFFVFGRAKDRRRDREYLAKTYFAPYAVRLLSDAGKLSELGGVNVTARSRRGPVLSGLYIPSPDAAQEHEKIMLIVHGYRADPTFIMAPQALYFRENGWSLLFPRLRAHGGSGGRFTSLGIREADDLLGWMDWAAEAHPGAKLCIYGQSMGAAAAAFAADRLTPDTVSGIIADSPFPSPVCQVIRMAGSLHLPRRLIVPAVRLIGRVFLHADIASTAEPALEKASVPMLFIRGERDSTVSRSDTESMYFACASEKRFVTVPGAEHTLAFIAGGDMIKSEIAEFTGKCVR